MCYASTAGIFKKGHDFCLFFACQDRKNIITLKKSIDLRALCCVGKWFSFLATRLESPGSFFEHADNSGPILTS